MATTSLGASVGRGPAHFVLLEVDDGAVVARQVRTIDPGPSRLGSRYRELVDSGFDLLTGQSAQPVAASAVAVRTRRDLIAARLGRGAATGSAEVVREIDAMIRALGEGGAIERYPVTMIVDLGASGMRVHTVVDGAAVHEVSTHSVAIPGVEPGADTPEAAARFLRRALEQSPQTPEAMVMVGGGAQHAGVRDAVEAAARSAGARPVTVDDPESVAATGAALLAADRSAGKLDSTPSRLGAGLGSFGGHSVRLTAIVVPVLVVAALAVLAASYATGLIGPTRDASLNTESAVVTTPPTSVEQAQPTVGGMSATETFSTTTAPVAPMVTAPPIMTTFAPPPTYYQTPAEPTFVAPPTAGTAVPPSPTAPEQTSPTVPGSAEPTVTTPPSRPPGESSAAPQPPRASTPSSAPAPLAPVGIRSMPPRSNTSPSGNPIVGSPPPTVVTTPAG